VQQYFYPIGSNKKRKKKNQALKVPNLGEETKTQEQEMCYVGRPIDGHCNSFA
jgi:hypothetical protein